MPTWAKYDTLLKDREPQKPYPIPRRIPIKPIERRVPPSPSRGINSNQWFGLKKCFFAKKRNRLLNLFGLLTCVILIPTSCKRKFIGFLAVVPLSFQEFIHIIPSLKRFQFVSIFIWAAPVHEALYDEHTNLKARKLDQCSNEAKRFFFGTFKGFGSNLGWLGAYRNK